VSDRPHGGAPRSNLRTRRAIVDPMKSLARAANDTSGPTPRPPASAPNVSRTGLAGFAAEVPVAPLRAHGEGWYRAQNQRLMTYRTSACQRSKLRAAETVPELCGRHHLDAVAVSRPVIDHQGWGQQPQARERVWSLRRASEVLILAVRPDLI